MNGSKVEIFQKELQQLNAEFEAWVKGQLKENSSASLQDGIDEYQTKLQLLETKHGCPADALPPYAVHPCPYQLTPQSLTKVVHFIRHGNGFHNPPLFCDEYDARLTAMGWKQAFELRKHILNLKTPFIVQLVVTSPLSRCLETATGIFGYEKMDAESHLLKKERPPGSEGKEPSHPNFYKSKTLPIVAQELCRECLLGNKCDKRRTRSDLAAEYPTVDFSKLEYDEDLLGQTVTQEWGEKVKKRARSFIKWLINRLVYIVLHFTFDDHYITHHLKY